VKRALLVDIGSENWEVEEQRMKKKGGAEMDVSNWVILSILLGYMFWASVLYILVGGDWN
jgi:hypothetical protein